MAAEAVRWNKRGTRGNTISPGIAMTPLASVEPRDHRGVCGGGAPHTPDEVATFSWMVEWSPSIGMANSLRDEHVSNGCKSVLGTGR